MRYFNDLEVASALHVPQLEAQKESVMNIKAILASLVLASSSAAMAAPSVIVSATARGSIGTPSHSTTVVRDRRDAPSAYTRANRSRRDIGSIRHGPSGPVVRCGN